MGVPVIRGSNLTLGDSRFRSDSFVFVSEETASRLSRSICRPLDIVFTKKGTIGQTGLVPSNGKYDRYLLSSNQMKLTVDPEQADPLFVYYYVSSTDSREKVLRDSEATGVPKTNLTYFRNFPIQLPHLDEQKRIANILSTLDDKIDLTRRMNETLEAMARRLFKSWFIDFDPVHAKAALRREHPNLSNADLSRRALPNMVPEIAELFPDSFEDSSLGPIPTGWKATTVGEDFSLTMGQSPPGSTYNDIGEGLPFYQGKTDFQTRFPVRRIYCTAPTRYAKRLDTLVSVRAPVGAINMAREDCAIGRGLAAIRHNSGSHSYTYYAMEQQAEAFQHFEAEGTVFGSINKSNFENLSHIAPVGSVVIAFDALVANSDEMIHTVTSETELLASVRDKLLPRLLSGELPVERYTEVCDE